MNDKNDVEENFCKYHEFNCIKCPYGEKELEGITWCRVCGNTVMTMYGKE